MLKKSFIAKQNYQKYCKKIGKKTMNILKERLIGQRYRK
jgi:hypothetical protein